MSRGALLLQDDAAIRAQATRQGLDLTVGPLSIPYQRTLIVGPGVAVPWRLINAPGTERNTSFALLL